MSALNCRPGDLARVVSKRPENQDKIVRVLEAFTGARDEIGAPLAAGEHYWVVDPPLTAFYTRAIPGPYVGTVYIEEGRSPSRIVPDRFLRPIRDSDGEDEVLRYAGLPNQPTKEPA